MLAAGQSTQVTEEDQQGGLPIPPHSRERDELPVHIEQGRIGGWVVWLRVHDASHLLQSTPVDLARALLAFFNHTLILFWKLGSMQVAQAPNLVNSLPQNCDGSNP